MDDPKVEEGVELFEETMTKIHDANSENQREKFQDDLKKEIKKLQRQRDQIKTWQNSSDVKDKERLEELKKAIEEKMQRFKSIERVNKTKPHSKMGLNAEEKIDPKEKERGDTIEWLQAAIGKLTEQNDIFEAKLEILHSSQSKKKKGKEDKKKTKETEDCKFRLERHKFHIQKLELIMRLVNNDSIECDDVNNLKDDLNDYIDRCQEDDFVENEFLYDDLCLGDTAEIIQALGSITNIGTLDENVSETSASPAPSPSPLQKENTEPVVPSEPVKTRHSSGGVEQLQTWNRAGLRSSSTNFGSRSAHSTPQKLTSQMSIDSALSTPPPAATPPLPPGIPYNIAAATRSHPPVQSPSPSLPQQQSVSGVVNQQEEVVINSESTAEVGRGDSPQQQVVARNNLQVLVNGDCSEKPVTNKDVLPLSVIAEQAVGSANSGSGKLAEQNAVPAENINCPQAVINDPAAVQVQPLPQQRQVVAYNVDSGASMIPHFFNDFLNRAGSASSQQQSQEAQTAKIPPCLGYKSAVSGREGIKKAGVEVSQKVFNVVSEARRADSNYG